MTGPRTELLIAAAAYCLAMVSYWVHSWIEIYQRWIFKYGVYSGMLIMLIYFIRLRLRAEGVDPESRKAYKEYLKLGSWICFTIFIMELPTMISSLK